MAWYRRFLNLFRSERVQRDIARELAFHVAERADDLAARGMETEAAAREARRRVGNLTAHAERTRERDLLGWLDDARTDIRYTLRSLAGAPVFTLTAVLSLALGIGANTAIFSLIDAVLLRPLPVSHPEQLARVHFAPPEGPSLTHPLWEALRREQAAFSGLAAYGRGYFETTTSGEKQQVSGDFVNGDYFNVLGVGASAGRVITPADDYRGCPAVAVLSDVFWRSRYGGGEVLGQNVRLNDVPFQIIGVARQGFFGAEVGRSPDLFLPLCSEALIRGKYSALYTSNNWWLTVFGRLRAGVSLESARAQVRALGPALLAATLPPKWNAEQQGAYRARTFEVTATPAGVSSLRTNYRKILYLLLGVTGTVLLVACANVANLVLARAEARQREMAIRLGMGATRGRLVRQLLTESLLLSAAGVVAGTFLAAWGSRVLVSTLSSRSLPVVLDLPHDLRMFGFTVAMTLGTAALFGLTPAWRSANVDPQATLKNTARSTSTRSRGGKVLATAQMAFSLVLVVIAVMLVGTFRDLNGLDAGFERENVTIVRADLRFHNGLPNDAAMPYREIERRLMGFPGVVSVGTAMTTPTSGSSWRQDVVVDGEPPRQSGDANAYFNKVTSGYFPAIGTPVLAGRNFGPADENGSARVALVNAAFARRFVGSGNAIGKRLQDETGEGTIEIIGVVKDAKYVSLRAPTPPTVYLALAHDTAGIGSGDFAVRTRGEIPGLRDAIIREIAAVNPDVVVSFITLDQQVRDSLRQERLLATLSAIFGGVALLLAAVGLYGLMAYSISRRRGEIGIRMALGATGGRVWRMIVGEVGQLVIVGLLLGTVGALAATRLIASFLYGMGPYDTRSFAMAAMVLAATAFVAGFLPAWRASRLDPMIALREE